jgi:hypothetical protein
MHRTVNDIQTALRDAQRSSEQTVFVPSYDAPANAMIISIIATSQAGCEPA